MLPYTRIVNDVGDDKGAIFGPFLVASLKEYNNGINLNVKYHHDFILLTFNSRREEGYNDHHRDCQEGEEERLVHGDG